MYLTNDMCTLTQATLPYPCQPARMRRLTPAPFPAPPPRLSAAGAAPPPWRCPTHASNSPAPTTRRSAPQPASCSLPPLATPAPPLRVPDLDLAAPITLRGRASASPAGRAAWPSVPAVSQPSSSKWRRAGYAFRRRLPRQLRNACAVRASPVPLALPSEESGDAAA
jgi:hypothetical protein